MLGRFCDRVGCLSTLRRAFATLPAGAEKVELPELPYEYSALEPYISGEIMELHHSKHHQAYVTNYNKALDQWKEAEEKQEASGARKIASALHFNGGGHVNHSIFWNNLCPAKDSVLEAGPLAAAIERDFGSLEKLQALMNAEAAGVQGSGWCWLGVKPLTGQLAVVTSPNQDTLSYIEPTLDPILGIDVWEHAYYLQYKNVRPDYLKAVWNVVNWRDVGLRYSSSVDDDQS